MTDPTFTEAQIKDALDAFFGCNLQPKTVEAYSNSMRAAITALLAAAKAGERADGAMREALERATTHLEVCRVFVSSRERMHKCGRDLHDEIVKDCRQALTAAPKAPIAEKWRREQIGRAIYLAMYQHEGAKWEANDSKETWYRIADKFSALLPAPPHD